MDELHREERGALRLSPTGPGGSRRVSGFDPGSRLLRFTRGAVRSALLAILLSGTVTACTVTERPYSEDRSRVVSGAPADITLVVPMLRTSARSWNAGDLEGFLDDYASDPSLTFVGSSGILRGIERVRSSYEEGYWASGAPEDSLRFADIEVRPLGEEHALATGRWILFRPTEPSGDDVTGQGWFSLVLHWQNGQWKIVHDHSS